MAWEQPITTFNQGTITSDSLWNRTGGYLGSTNLANKPSTISFNPWIGDGSLQTARTQIWGTQVFGIYYYEGLYYFLENSDWGLAWNLQSRIRYQNGRQHTLYVAYDPVTDKANIQLTAIYTASGFDYYDTYVADSLDPNASDNNGRIARIAKAIYLENPPAPPYNWQSVPSISGKNGILSLATLKEESINDGEPVSGAAVSVFDQNPVSGNNVKDIVDGNTPLIPSAVDVTAAFIISNPPVGELASRILAAKKGSIPESIEDADKTVSIPANASNVTMPGLDENSQYYFAIFVADATGDTAVSDPKDIYTSADEGWSFDYTGSIQTFVAPKTGIYQLETWGAQGGDASDGTRTARGGYGAYAVVEVFLTQGDTLYINVGGQNGYGGGGNGEIKYDIDDLLISTDVTNYVGGGSGDMSSIKSLAEQYENTDKVIYTYHKYSGSGDYSSPSMIYNNNKEFIYSRGNGVVTGYTGFPIRGMSGMKSIEFDIVTTDTEDGTFAIALIDGNDHHAYLYSEAPYATSGGLKHVVVDSGLSDYAYTYFVIGIQRTLTISNVKITYAT